MSGFETRTSIAQDNDRYYIATQIKYNNQWMTINRISEYFDTKEAATDYYNELSSLGYMCNPKSYTA
ncbi:hypothetical protein BVAD3_39860 (plasmid) [Bacillus velezensis]|nr:hypothetical protein BVAD3_39860 [Bacillus velezensis]